MKNNGSTTNLSNNQCAGSANENHKKLPDESASLGLSNANPTVHPASVAPGSVASPKTTIVKQTFLVFNDSGNSVLTATLRVCNPSSKSDIFYKLYSDYYRLCFRVKSWKGHVRRNSYVEVVISTNVMSAKDRTAEMLKSGGENYQHCITLSQLCQTKFTLELTEYVSKFRNFNGGSTANGNANNNNGNGNSGNNGSFNRTNATLMANNSCSSVKNKFELQCVTREVLLKMQNETKINIDDMASINRDGANKLPQGLTKSGGDNEQIENEGGGDNVPDDSEQSSLENKNDEYDTNDYTNELFDAYDSSEQDNSTDSSPSGQPTQVEPITHSSNKSNQQKDKQINGTSNSAGICSVNPNCPQNSRKLFGIGKVDSLLVMVWLLITGLVKSVLSFFAVQLQKIKQKIPTRGCDTNKVVKDSANNKHHYHHYNIRKPPT